MQQLERHATIEMWYSESFFGIMNTRPFIELSWKPTGNSNFTCRGNHWDVILRGNVTPLGIIGRDLQKCHEANKRENFRSWLYCQFSVLLECCMLYDHSIFLLMGWKLKEGLCSLCVSLSLACVKTCGMHRLQAESKPYLLLSMLPFWLQQACRLLCLGSNVSMSEPSLFMRRALLLQPSCPTLVFQLCSLPARLKHVRSNTKLPWYYWSW